MAFRSLLNRLVPGKPSTPGGTWVAPRVLDRGRVGRPQIAMDKQGNALAAWHHWSESEEGVYIRRYSADQRTWDVVPRRLDTARTQARAPEIAMNHKGEIAVVWYEQEEGRSRVCARHMLGTAETWVPYPATLQDAPGQIHGLRAAMDLDGNIHAVWCQGTTRDFRVYACGYHAANGSWDIPPIQLGEASRVPLFPQLALNEAGQGLVVWSAESASDGDRILACHYDASVRCWSDRPILIAKGRAAHLRMGMDASGNAIVLWVEEAQSGIQTLHASHLDGRAVTWTRAPLLASGRDIRWPQVGLDGRGQAHAVWRQEMVGETKELRLFTKRFARGRWDEQRMLLVEDQGESQAHALSVNAQGHALVLWLQDQGAQSIVCVRHFDGASWSPRPVLLGVPGRREIQSPGAVLSSEGHAGVIWRQGNVEDGRIITAVGEV